MKVLVTGFTGFIGSKTAQRYIQEGNVVSGVCRNTLSKSPENTIHQTKSADLSSVLVNDMIQELTPDVLIHCAGSADVRKSVDAPLDDFDHNVRACYNLLESVRLGHPETRIVFLSSAAVYGTPKRLPIDETSQTCPVSPYGLHKTLCEDICRYYRDAHSMHIDIARIFSAYGEGQKKQILWDFYQKYQNTGEIPLYGTGGESRDYIHIDDIIDAISLIALKGENSEYNVASGDEVTIKNLALKFAKALSIPEHLVTFTGVEKKGDPKNWKADTSRLRNLGFHQKVSLEQGLQRYARWVQQQ